MGIQMKRKELTKTFVMISNWRINSLFSKNISVLSGLTKRNIPSSSPGQTLAPSQTGRQIPAPGLCPASPAPWRVDLPSAWGTGRSPDPHDVACPALSLCHLTAYHPRTPA